MVREGREFDRPLERSADVVVVGSGAGGPVVAKELQEKGHSVILLEEGGYYTSQDFKNDPIYAFRTFYRDNATTIALGLPAIPFPLGRAIGGSTIINSGTCFRTPDSILHSWERIWGLPDVSPEFMRPYFERVEKIISVNPVHAGNMGRNGEIFLRGARTLGYSCGPLKRNQNENCTGCGICTLGCPQDGKRHTGLNYIPQAEALGAEVYADFRVEKILTQGNTAVGVSGSILDRSSGRRRTTFTVRAKIAVLAAGAISTPLLLLTNRLANSSGQAGKNLRLHPGIRVNALMAEEVRGWLGVPQGVYVDEFWHEGIMLEGVFVGPMLSAPSLPYFGWRAKELMFNYPRIAAFGAMIHDETRGTVRPGPRHLPLIFYRMVDEDLRKAQKAIAYAAEIFLAAGAQRVFTTLPWLPEVSSKKGVSQILTGNLKRGDLEMMAFHPMGTCRMGTDPEKCVVGPYGETFDVRNLYIADASIFPSCLGVNPMESIMAFAHRTADYIHSRL